MGSIITPEMIESIVKPHLKDTCVDALKFWVEPEDVKSVSDYFKEKGYNFEIVSQSTSRIAVEPGLRSFRQYFIVRKKEKSTT